MTLPKYARIQSDDETVNRVQDRIRQVTDPVVAVPFLDGRSITVSLASGVPNIISHGLNRAPSGYLVTRMNADARIWADADTADAASFLRLRTSATVTATLWVF